MDAINATITMTAMATTMASPRSLLCHYNPGTVTAALAVSLLGAFTSTQLMYQARGARTLSGVFIWTVLGSLVFGFCATWCLHFLGMLSCEFDIPIGLNVPLTILSAVLAVSFTFGALSVGLIQKRWRRLRRKRAAITPYRPIAAHQVLDSERDTRLSSEPLLRPSHELSERAGNHSDAIGAVDNELRGDTDAGHNQAGNSSTDTLVADSRDNRTAHKGSERSRLGEDTTHPRELPFPDTHHRNYDDGYDDGDSDTSASTIESRSRLRLSNDYHEMDTTRADVSRTSIVHDRRSSVQRNTLLVSATAVFNGLTLINVVKGFIWSIALTNMHFMGVKALSIPGGFVELSPARVVLCATISWSVCCVGVILMGEMEANIKQQVLFSVVAATGVAAVHFSGMYACSFWSTEAPSLDRGYPVALPVTIASVAFLTCMMSTGLLAHSATAARDKLADVLYTRRRLWAAIAQKENAEAAAAARSEFIASASHEIRTPLHQLQGYADLLSKSELSEEDRLLLLAIQHATKSLSMITSNVLDWSRLEKGEAICRPVAVDIRLACEGIVHILPNREDNTETELLVVVAPEVPSSIFIDETYLQRILMNLLSNSFKFTISGYVMLLLHVRDEVLHIVVKDTGVGIPRSFLPQLFEPYKQVQARGAERGTGLGLSITKRLLQRMQGSIDVESKYKQDEGVGEANSGSQFTLTVPVITSDLPAEAKSRDLVGPVRIVIMHDGRRRDIEGLTAAWESMGAEVSRAEGFTDIPSDPAVVIWADVCYLQKNHNARRDILHQQQFLVLVPYENRSSLDEVLGSTPPVNIVPVRKPLIWHRIVQTITDMRQVSIIPGDVKDIVMVSNKDLTQNSASAGTSKAPLVARKRTVLLVEDNKINLKLGVKMLAMLKYDVLVAEDGQEAIDIVKEHALTIDVILMDQSMPRKDGLTATKEIRELEAQGLLGKRQTIIAVTAAAGPEAQSQFSEAGIDMFLSKPLSMAKLEQTLSHYFTG